MKFNSSLLSLILVNLIPLAGVFFGWSVLSILLFYWFESFAVGFFNVIKMYIAPVIPKGRVNNSPFQGKLAAIITKLIFPQFFMVHYGGFMTGHLVFILAVGSISSSGTISFEGILDELKLIILPAIMLFVSHGYSFFKNFIGKKEFENTSVAELMFSPYKRIIIMHITLIFGAFITIVTKMPFYIIALFIVLKTFIDVKAHEKEHMST